MQICGCNHALKNKNCTTNDHNSAMCEPTFTMCQPNHIHATF
uniref:Uncharacterized protein n=1 Tax=Rhizophora mucronata TaxID=61149 RepID=A0A2P2NY63_RHIMU